MSVSDNFTSIDLCPSIRLVETHFNAYLNIAYSIMLPLTLANILICITYLLGDEGIHHPMFLCGKYILGNSPKN